MTLQKLKSAGTRNGHEYWYDEFGTLFTDPLPQGNKVGGEDEEARNARHNPERLQRIHSLRQGESRVLDFGCGSGILVDFLNKNGVPCDGYDPHSSLLDFRLSLPDEECYGVLTAIEVVEHLAEPFSEFDEWFRVLLPGGMVMIESSFSDFIDIHDNYCNPELGHSTIWSHKGLNYAMAVAGFAPYKHLNRNVRVYRKP